MLRIYIPKEFNVDYNTEQFQPIDSDNCGSFVIYSCINHHFNQDLPFNELLNLIFKIDTNANEKKVEDFLKKIKWTQKK